MNPTIKAIDIAVSDLDAAITFYRRLGLEFVPDPHMPTDHAGCDLPNGLHLMLDTDDLRAKTTANWTRRRSGGPSWRSSSTPRPRSTPSTPN
jgi:catechol 2,3-dioxygenase-like lactoylglutathione lyase family enzyme